ncbi:MAG: N-acetyltransferase [Verrucomicrobia bacterium]|nr:N-acetyltransferase [Verrucomicrobiota bacterium]
MITRPAFVLGSPSDLVLRPEGDGDADEIRRVLVAAFGGDAEARLVEALRNHAALVASLVACAAGEIVGHLAFSPMHADGQPDRRDLLGLAPVAVHPQWQQRGIGSALLRTGLDECRRRAVAAVFVLGDPEFYSRFGFRSGHVGGLSCVFPAPAGAFQVLPICGALGSLPSGLIRYRPEFDSFL